MSVARAIGAVAGAAALGISAPAQACSCIPPENLEREGRAALASADLAAVLEVDPKPALPRLWCRSDGRARPWFRPGLKVEQDRPARVVRVMKGQVPSAIRVRESPIVSAGGYCATSLSSCDVTVSAGRNGPLLFRRVAPGVFEPISGCAQSAFTLWYERSGSATKGR